MKEYLGRTRSAGRGLLGLPRRASRRFFSLWYSYALMGSRHPGRRDTRLQPVCRAEGAVLEIGACGGSDVRHHANGAKRLSISDPSPFFVTHLRRKLKEPTPEGAWQVDLADAESLPYPDNSFDTVVSVFVFCAIPDPEHAFREIDRVLRPGGSHLFLEHVRAGPGTVLGWFQDRLAVPTRVLTGGCFPNRVVAELLEDFPLQIEEVVAGTMPRAFPTLKPTIRGVAHAV